MQVQKSSSRLPPGHVGSEVTWRGAGVWCGFMSALSAVSGAAHQPVARADTVLLSSYHAAQWLTCDDTAQWLRVMIWHGGYV